MNCADIEEQLRAGKLGQEICIRFLMKTGINLEGSASYGRSRSALASSASCYYEMMSVGLNKIFRESMI